MSGKPLQAIYAAVSPSVQLAEEEEKILNFWDQKKIFEATLKASENKPFYSFYDGPPFATGLPHYGHILAGVLKDIVPRYWTMRGFHIPRFFGWDCHGVPVEYEVNKDLQIKSSAQVREMGVARYNEQCRSIVDRYTQDWRRTVRRVGRWVDMDHAYHTMDLEFMQSVWWVFKELWKKGLIYEGYKVVPYSIGISTPLSNFEASQNYKDVQDPALTVRFKVKDKKNLSFLAWTTTPWTLPSNLGLAVGKDMDYVQVAIGDEEVILAEALLPAYKKETGDPAKITARYKGSDLLGWKYEPLFKYFTKIPGAEKAFQVIASSHVTTDAGTGIVHMAPAFGEEDFLACKAAGMPIVNPVDDDGCFTAEVPDYQGRMVKDADKDIIAALKKQGSLLRHDTLTHSYPHCERTDTPLIYRAVSSWFVKVESIRDRVVANNRKTHWIPETLRDGRFGNWLENARDWAISRNRFWGTPLPIWKNAEGETVCVGSAEELQSLSGSKTPIKDLHLHHIQDLTIPSPTGKSPLKLIGSVLDCWFESGSMPVASWGYPYVTKNKSLFERGFPADFIAEGLDQTRGWFYTLMVLSTALFDKPAFKNCVVNGIILAEDGRKMSKRLKNYPDPIKVIGEFGADALRLCLINSPVVKAQDLSFSEKAVREIVRKILLRWWNAYSFFVSYANIDQFKPKGDAQRSPNILDQWILSRLNSLILKTNREMEQYRLYNVVPALVQFIEELTNTYIRFNRRHFWQNGMPEDKRLAYETLYHVLMELSRLMAPFTPFIAEMIYLNLSKVSANKVAESVHLESYPQGDAKLSQPALEKAVERMEQITLMARNLREKLNIKGKIPLQSLKIIHRDPRALEELKRLETYLIEEINVRSILYDSQEDRYVTLSAKANFQRLGKRLGPKMKTVAQALNALKVEQILEMEAGQALHLQDETFTLEDLDIRRTVHNQSPAFSNLRDISIEIDSTVTAEQIQEGLSREVVRRVQMARKNAGLNLDDRIQLQIHCEGDMLAAARAHEKYLQSETLAVKVTFCDSPSGNYREDFDIDGDILTVAVSKA